jgi:hypothetical protein
MTWKKTTRGGASPLEPVHRKGGLKKKGVGPEGEKGGWAARARRGKKERGRVFSFSFMYLMKPFEFQLLFLI